MARGQLRIGITGAGSMGRAHANAVEAAGARVVAVHDANSDAAEALAQTVGADRATDCLNEIFDASLDGLVVTTPPAVRVAPVRIAAERGVHLMIEKPPALTMEDARACLSAIAQSGVISAVGLQLRYAPLYERLREILAAETVHLVRTVCTVDYYLTFRMAPWFLQKRISGGPLAEQAIHLLDCVRYVLGDPKPVRAAALGAKNMAGDRPEYDAENALQMTYELDNGAFGVHTNHCGTERFAFDMEMIGPHLRLRANVTENRITGYLHGSEIDEPAPTRNPTGLDKIGAWLNAIETGDRSLIRSDFADATQTLALIQAAIASQKTGRFVAVEEV